MDEEIARSETLAIGALEPVNHHAILIKQAPANAHVYRVGGIVHEVTRDIDLEGLVGARTCANEAVEFDTVGCELKDGVAALVRLEAHNGLLSVDVSVRAIGTTRALLTGIEHIEQVVAIAVAVPAPIHVEHAIAIIAVADEGVSTGQFAAAVDDRASSGQLTVEEVGPSLCTVVAAAHLVGASIVVEVGGRLLGD